MANDRNMHKGFNLTPYKNKGTFEAFDQKSVASNSCAGATTAMLTRFRYGISTPKLSQIPPGEMKEFQKKAHDDKRENPIGKLHSIAGFTTPTKSSLVKPSDIATHLKGKSTAAIQATVAQDGEVKGEHAVAFGKVNGKCTFSDSRLGTFTGFKCASVRRFAADWAKMYAAPDTQLTVVSTDEEESTPSSQLS